MKDFAWQEAGSMNLIHSGYQINPAEFLFEKIEDDIKSQYTRIFSERSYGDK